MTKLIIVVVWVALVIWWVTPEVTSVRNKIIEHNAQIQKALEE